MNNLPIRRNPIFYDATEYDYETQLLEGYLEEDVNQTVIVYEVDRTRTNTNNTYNEAQKDTIKYKTPKEIPCLYKIDNSEVNSFDGKSNTGAYQVSGNITVYIMQYTLDKYQCDIRRGDYLGVQIDSNRVYYFTVTDDGKVNTGNDNILGAYKVSFRTIKGAPAQEFNGK